MQCREQTADTEAHVQMIKINPQVAQSGFDLQCKAVQVVQNIAFNRFIILFGVRNMDV